MESVKYFTSIALHSKYSQCHTTDEDIPKITFLMRYSLYQWVVVPIGLTNIPDTFMCTMNYLFSNMVDCRIAVFLNNILVYSYAVKEHFIFLEKVLAYLYQYTFYYMLKKYSFLCNSTIFLDFDATPTGMHISDLKVQSLNEWPVPTMVR